MTEDAADRARRTSGGRWILVKMDGWMDGKVEKGGERVSERHMAYELNNDYVIPSD